MNKEQYLDERVENQINWYDVKSTNNQKMFKCCRSTEIICAAIIPLLAGFGDYVPNDKFIIGTLSALIAICAGLSALNKYQENWITYRTTCETLRHQKYLFQTNSYPYDIDDAYNIFVRNFESLISKENSQWYSHNRIETSKESTG